MSKLNLDFDVSMNEPNTNLKHIINSYNTNNYIH